MPYRVLGYICLFTITVFLLAQDIPVTVISSPDTDGLKAVEFIYKPRV